MTSMAFVFGLFPMSIATGPSAQGNHSISIGAAGGMVSGVLLGLFIIPVLFVIFQALQERITGVPVAVLLDDNGQPSLNSDEAPELAEEYIR
jgi:HAE1 family hydrophobic/amphiphilic exporter-1